MIRHAWAVVALGLLLACRGPKPPAPPEPPPAHDFGEASAEEYVQDLERRGQTLEGFAFQAPPSLFLFDLNSTEVRQVREVRKLASFLARTEQSVLLQGHACPLGSETYNLALGYHRAQAVAELLRETGISGKRIEVSSLGEERPVTLDPAHFAENRRVEVVFR